jgi:hypothetical protein
MGLGRTWITGCLLIAVACSGGQDDAGARGETRHKAAGISTAPTSTTTAPPVEPPGSKPQDVQAFVQALLGRYDRAVNRILHEPSVARHHTDQTVQEFLGLFDGGNDFAARSLDAWRGYADRGVALEPLSSRFPVNVTSIDGPVRTVGDDEVTFAYCEVQRYSYREHGREADRVDQELVPGTGTAVRVEGKWRLRSLLSPPGLKGCFSGTGVRR